MWKDFDADKTTELKNFENKMIRHLLGNTTVDKDTASTIRNNAIKKLEQYKKSQIEDLNKTEGLFCFRPNEFKSVDKYDNALTEFENKFKSFEIPWHEGSEPIKNFLNSNWSSAGDEKIDIGMGRSYKADNFIKIKDCNVVVESETSNNLDNGIITINKFIHERKADFGIIIVPWFKRGSGSANVETVISKLDKITEFTNNKENPVFAIAVFRKLDFYKLLSDKKEDDLLSICKLSHN